MLPEVDIDGLGEIWRLSIPFFVVFEELVVNLGVVFEEMGEEFYDRHLVVLEN